MPASKTAIEIPELERMGRWGWSCDFQKRIEVKPNAQAAAFLVLPDR